MVPSSRSSFCVFAIIVILKSFLQGTFAQAAENDLSPNDLDRLHFRTPAQDVLATFDFTPDVLNHTVTNSHGSPSAQSMKNRFPLALAATLGITDLLSFEASEAYLIHSVQTNINDRTGTQTTPASSGLSDPSFRASYRYLGGLVGTTFADAFINFSPSVGDNQSTSSSQDGNALRGDTTIEVGSDVYQVLAANEFSLGASWILTTAKNTDSANPANDELGNEFSTFDFRLRYRYHFNGNFFTQAQGILYMPYSTSYSYYNSSNNRMENDHFPFYAVPRLSWGYLPAASTLFTAGISYTNYTRSTSSTSAVLQEVTLDFGVSVLF